MKKYCVLIISVLICSLTASDITFNEVLGAKQLFERGNVEEARSMIGTLKHDRDKNIAEQAWFVHFDLFNDLFTPVTYLTEPSSSVVSHYVSWNNEDFDSFRKKYPKSRFTEKISGKLEKDVSEFGKKMNSLKNMRNVFISDSSSISYGSDSTFTVSFEKPLSDSGHDIFRVSYSGKLIRYEPWGDMKDEWGSTGLILDYEGKLTFELNGVVIREINRPVEIKQYPEYVLRRVTEYGFTQNKTFIREDDIAGDTSLAAVLDGNTAVERMNFKLLFGKMNELVPYHRDSPGEGFPKYFNSKAYIDMSLFVK